MSPKLPGVTLSRFRSTVHRPDAVEPIPLELTQPDDIRPKPARRLSTDAVAATGCKATIARLIP